VVDSDLDAWATWPCHLDSECFWRGSKKHTYLVDNDSLRCGPEFCKSWDCEGCANYWADQHLLLILRAFELLSVETIYVYPPEGTTNAAVSAQRLRVNRAAKRLGAQRFTIPRQHHRPGLWVLSDRTLRFRDAQPTVVTRVDLEHMLATEILALPGPREQPRPNQGPLRDAYESAAAELSSGRNRVDSPTWIGRGSRARFDKLVEEVSGLTAPGAEEPLIEGPCIDGMARRNWRVASEDFRDGVTRSTRRRRSTGRGNGDGGVWRLRRWLSDSGPVD
jgi:hypothetical protein